MFTVAACVGFTAQPRVQLEDAWIVVKCNRCDAAQTLSNLGQAGERERDPTGTSFTIGHNGITRNLVCTSDATHTGSIRYTSTRVSPANFQLAVVAQCNDESTHATRRILVSYISLCVLHRLVSTDRVKEDAVLQAPGASIQRAGRPSSDQNQLAHQILREITINGKFFYQLPGLEEGETVALVYCHSVCSDIPTRYNRADGFVEQKIRTPYLNFAGRILKNEFTVFTHAKSPGSEDRGAHPSILNGVIAMFITACDEARAIPPGDPFNGIIDGYKTSVQAMTAKASVIADKSLDDWIKTIQGGGVRSI